MIKIIKKGKKKLPLKFKCNYCNCEYATDEYDDREKYINNCLYNDCPNCGKLNILETDNNTKFYEDKEDK